jgi:hypothetical protein
MASNKGVIIELKGVGRKCRGLTLRYSPSIFLEGLRKTRNTSVRKADLQAEI